MIRVFRFNFVNLIFGHEYYCRKTWFWNYKKNVYVVVYELFLLNMFFKGKKEGQNLCAKFYRVKKWLCCLRHCVNMCEIMFHFFWRAILSEELKCRFNCLFFALAFVLFQFYSHGVKLIYLTQSFKTKWTKTHTHYRPYRLHYILCKQTAVSLTWTSEP